LEKEELTETKEKELIKEKSKESKEKSKEKVKESGPIIIKTQEISEVDIKLNSLDEIITYPNINEENIITNSNYHNNSSKSDLIEINEFISNIDSNQLPTLNIIKKNYDEASNQLKRQEELDMIQKKHHLLNRRHKKEILIKDFYLESDKLMSDLHLEEIKQRY
jgi:hydroxymethylpyrimidine/phosphomethylpyrimidine kinase